jgi:ABC-2 type transport system permease protein
MTEIAAPASAVEHAAGLAPAPGILAPALTLARRELVRFVRQRSRVASALLQPVIIFVFFGAALNGSFKPPKGTELSYSEYLFPGTIAMILMFTAIFATISIIEDRREGFLQSVLVAPAPRLSMVLGKLLGGTALAMMQGLLFLIAGYFFIIPMSAMALLQAVGVMCLISFALCGLGFIIAWRMDSTQGFHAIMMLFLMPMLMLSGAFFPDDGVHLWLSWIMKLNPLTYGLAALRYVMYGGRTFEFLPDFTLSMAVSIAFALITVAGSVAISGSRTTGDLQ